MKVILKEKASHKEEEKRENAQRGTEFEAAIVKNLSPQKFSVQYKGKVRENIEQDAINCADKIRKRLGISNENIINAIQCGQHTSTEIGDVIVWIENGPKKGLRLEMKYINGNSNGTWHNTSADLFENLLGDKFGSHFMTVKELLNGPSMKEILGGNMEIPIDDVLTFVVNEKDTFNQVYAKLFEPFEPFDILVTGKDELDDMEAHFDSNAPLGNDTHTSTISDNYDSVILIKDGKSMYTRLMKDDEYEKYFTEDDDEFDGDDDFDFNDMYQLSNPRCWKFNGEEAVVNPAMIYEKVMSVIGNRVMGYLGKTHFETIKKNPILAEQVLGLFCDKKESSEKMKDGKRPDYLIVFARNKGSTTIFDCQNYGSNGTDTVDFEKLTDNRYSIGNDKVKFSFQYGWQGGAGIKNPTIRVFLQK